MAAVDMPDAEQWHVAVQYQAITGMSADVQTAREIEKEVAALLASREREERSISLVTPYYDVVREKQGESDDEPEEANETQV